MSEPATTSVIICAYSEERWSDLQRAVNAVRAQGRRSDELILVIDNNDALFAAASAEFADARVVPNQSARGLSGARNTGVDAASGDVLVFLDDDAAPEPGWLEALTRDFSLPEVVAVGGSAQPRWPGKRPRWFPAEFDWVVGCSFVGQPPGPRIRNPLGCNMAFRREVFEIAGMFSTEVGRVGKTPLGAEETELCIRMQQRAPWAIIRHVPEAQVRHTVTSERATWRYFRRRCMAEGLSKARMTRLVGSQDGLSSERTYVTRTLPRAFLRGLADACSGDASGLLRSGAVLAGVLLAIVGYLRGICVNLANRCRTSLHVADDSLF